MATHTQLPIYKVAYDLLDVVTVLVFRASEAAHHGHHTKLGRQAERLIQSRAKPGGKDDMAQSIIIVGPQGCGKTINAPGLCKAFKVNQFIDESDVHYLHEGKLPKEDHLIFATEWPRDTQGLKCVNFAFAISKVAKPHPMTRKQGA